MTTMAERPMPPRGPGRPGARGGQATQSAARGITGQDVLRILRRRWKMILVFLVAFTVLTVGGTVTWRLLWPRYTAVGVLRVTPPKQSVFRDDPYRNAEMLDRHKRNAAAMVGFEHVLRAALDSPEMQQTRWFRRLREGDPELNKATRELMDEIKHTVIAETDHITIGMSQFCSASGDREQLPTIVNQVMLALRDAVNSSQNRERTREVKTFQDSLELKKSRLNQLRTQIATKDRTAEPVTRQMDALATEVNELVKVSSELQTTRADLEKAYTSMQQRKRQGMLSTDPTIMRILEADPILRGLESDLVSSNAMMEIIRSKYGPNHQQRKTLEIRIYGLEQAIETARATLVENNIASMLALYEQELGKTIDMLDNNSQRLDGLKQRRRDLNKTLREIANLETEAEQLSKEIAILDGRLTDLEMVREDDLQAAVVAYANVPTEPSGPKLVIWIPLGIVVGLLVGVGLAFLIELTDTSVKTPTDMAARADLPLLAMIPHADDLDDEIEDYRLACLDGDHSMVSEAFRELWTSLQFSGPVESRRSLLVTSASPYDGRTCVSVNLGAIIAQGGRRVLLVDTNFRRPALSGLFPCDADTGLSDALSAQCQWADCVQHTRVPNLDILPAGKMPPNPTELLGSDLAKTILSEMRDQYDQVILDSPPLLLISDARVLASRVDGVVVVVRAGVNTYGIVQRCRKSLVDLGAHVVGGVLNGVRTTVGGYLQKNYDAFHEYQDTEV